MPTPLQSQMLARVQPQKQPLKSLPEMRADLYGFEMDNNTHPHVRMFAGACRHIVDHLILMVRGNQMQAQAIQKHAQDNEAKFAALVEEIRGILGPEPAAEPAPAQDAEPISDPVPVQQTAPPASATAVESAPPMTVTPVVRPKKKNGAAQ